MLLVIAGAAKPLLLLKEGESWVCWKTTLCCWRKCFKGIPRKCCTFGNGFYGKLWVVWDSQKPQQICSQVCLGGIFRKCCAICRKCKFVGTWNICIYSVYILGSKFRVGQSVDCPVQTSDLSFVQPICVDCPSACPCCVRCIHMYADGTMAHHEAFDPGWKTFLSTKKTVSQGAKKESGKKSEVIFVLSHSGDRCTLHRYYNILLLIKINIIFNWWALLSFS